MSREAAKYPGLNLSSAHGKDHEAAESLMFGFWVFLMSDAILFGMVFATYVTSVHATAGGQSPTSSTTSRASSSRPCCSWPAASLSEWRLSRSNTSTARRG